MFNPNNVEQMKESLMDDLGYLGMDIVDNRGNEAFEVGNQSITFATIHVCIKGVTVKVNGKILTTINYKGSLEQLSQDVCSNVVKLALKGKP